MNECESKESLQVEDYDVDIDIGNVIPFEKAKEEEALNNWLELYSRDKCDSNNFSIKNH